MWCEWQIPTKKGLLIINHKNRIFSMSLFNSRHSNQMTIKPRSVVNWIVCFGAGLINEHNSNELIIHTIYRDLRECRARATHFIDSRNVHICVVYMVYICLKIAKYGNRASTTRARMQIWMSNIPSRPISKRPNRAEPIN